MRPYPEVFATSVGVAPVPAGTAAARTPAPRTARRTVSFLMPLSRRRRPGVTHARQREGAVRPPARFKSDAGGRADGEEHLAARDLRGRRLDLGCVLAQP